MALFGDEVLRLGHLCHQVRVVLKLALLQCLESFLRHPRSFGFGTIFLRDRDRCHRGDHHSRHIRRRTHRLDLLETCWWARTTAPEPTPMVDFHVRRAHVEIDLHAGDGTKTTEARTMVWVEVDSSFMGIQWTGDPPMLTSPWGESHKAWHEELFSGLPAIYYNPYNTTEETSPEFEALMLSRAIEDVYGEVLPPDSLCDRYFVIEGGRIEGLTSSIQKAPGYGIMRSASGIPLLDDYPDLQSPHKGPETPTYMALVLVPWFLLTALFLHSFKTTHSHRYIRGIYWVGLAIPMLGMLSNVLLSVFGLFSPEAGRGSLDIMIRSLGASPSSWAATWLACLAAIGASYFLAMKRFERAEIPSSGINCSLVDWGQED
jgi:hypothetical protein